jgi:signal transduction histidine kinase
MTRDQVLSNYLKSAATLVVLDVSPQWLVTAANRHAVQLLGKDCVGRYCFDLLVEFQRDFNLEKLRLQSDVPQRLNFATCSGVPESLRVSWLAHDQGGLLVGEYELDDLQELRSSLTRINAELSNLSRDQVKNNVLLEQLDQQKNRFLGMAAHDLRNPIAAIQAYTNLFLDEEGDLSPELLEALGDIRSLTDFMLTLLSNTLDLNVIEQGYLNLEIRPIETTPFFLEQISLNTLLATAKKVVLEAVLGDVPPTFSGDCFKLKQVMNNLLSNAVKFSPVGSIVRISVQLDPDGLLRVEVIDQGAGIPEAEQIKLFTPFGRTSVRSTGGETSTGLGLAITKNIVLAHGGTIGVLSTVGAGSTFWFTLPV